MDISEIEAAFADAFDQAIVFHGFADYMRDYDLYVYATADPRSGIKPKHLRYRFKYCVRALVTSAVAPEIWRRSLDDALLDAEQASQMEGYVWGARWQCLYPGMKLLPASAEAQLWSQTLGLPFYEAAVETNGHNLSLIFSDLAVEALSVGDSPFIVSSCGPDFKIPLP